MNLRGLRKLALTPFFLLWALPAAAAYDVRNVTLGAKESDVRRALPSVHCKALEWRSKAADRRCDDSRVAFGGIEVQVTFYLKKDAVEAFDVRFDTVNLDKFVAFLKTRYGAPTAESRDSIERKGKPAREIHKVSWERAGERAVLVAQMEKRRASMLVYRGDFEEEIYRVR
jgi:hypothetical protein